MSYITNSSKACNSTLGMSKFSQSNAHGGPISQEFKDLIKRHSDEYEQFQNRQISELNNQICKMIGVEAEVMNMLKIKVKRVDCDDETIYIEMPGISQWLSLNSLSELLEGANNIFLKHKMAEDLLAEINKDKGVRKL